MINAMINTKIADFLIKEAEIAGVEFNEVEVGIKLMEVKENEEVVGYKPYYYLKINKVFKRYIDISELL